MDRLIYTSLAGVSESARPRQQLNNEIANLSTVGFKRSYTNAMKALKIDGPGFDTRFNSNNLTFDRVTLAAGPLIFTGAPLDIAMNGNTVLGVVASDDSLAFTRRGDLRVGASGLLETADGRAVRGENGTISVPPGSAVQIAGDGAVYATGPDRAQRGPPLAIGRLLLRDASATPLVRREDGLFTPAQGAGTTGGDINDGKEVPSLTVGTLEGSNVTAFESMTRLLDFSRSFESSMQLIKETRSIDEKGSTMLRGS